jgi:ribulose-phosphate 3-epimerase
MEIIPAILPRDFKDLEKHVEQVIGLVPLVQVDVCDGQFTPLPSWPCKKHDDNFDAIVRGDRGLPAWEDIDYEFDLMVNRPEDIVDDYVAAGATRIVIHAEARGDIAKAIESLQGKAEIGLALNIDTPLDAVEPYKDRIQYIQLMGIDNVGFQGQAFDEKVVAKIKELRKKYPQLEIQIDGGVNQETAPLLMEAGADRLVIGSAIFESDNAIEAVEKFKHLS